MLPAEEEAGITAGDLNGRDVYNQYEKSLPHWVRRELMAGKPQPGKRSEMLWKLEHTLIESGLSVEECFVLIKSSPWNKFRGRRNEDTQLRNELEKALDGRFNRPLVGKDKLHVRTDKEVREEEEPKRFLSMSMAEVEEEDLDWLWYPYLAKGELTILEGDPGLGKSYMAQMVAGAIVDGKRLPTERPTGKKSEQGAVAYFDIENSAGTVTKRRLVDNGVKNLVHYYQEETPFSIDDEDALDEIYEAIEKVRPKLVVFDTLNTYIGKADTHKSSEVQQAFGHFRKIAKDFNCAVLVLRHLTKGNKERAIYRGQGSIAFTGLARVVMTVGTDPEDEATRVMAVTKINVTRAPRALTFTIAELPKDRSRFDWGEFVDLSSDDILSSPRGPEKKDTTDGVEQAKQFLIDILEERGLELAKIRRMAEKRSISMKHLHAAKDSMVIKVLTEGFGKTKVTVWELQGE
jgi:archaellum biogenesis ATPase FlaH